MNKIIPLLLFASFYTVSPAQAENVPYTHYKENQISTRTIRGKCCSLAITTYRESYFFPVTADDIDTTGGNAGEMLELFVDKIYSSQVESVGVSSEFIRRQILETNPDFLGKTFYAGDVLYFERGLVERSLDSSLWCNFLRITDANTKIFK